MRARDPSAPPDAGRDPILAKAPHRVGAVTLVVNDLARASDFYEHVIGLAQLGGDGGGATLGTAGRPLLVLRHEAKAPRWMRQEAGLFHTAFLLPGRGDLGAWLQHMAANRWPIAGASDHIVSEAVYLSDPEGNGIEVYADRPSATWVRTAAGVTMSTDPLDLQGILDTVSGPWAGMPADGCIGHVHLQSGDLSRASAFYADLLGFEIMARYPGALFYGSGGYHHQLATNLWNSRGAAKRTGLTTGLEEVELLVTGPEGLSAIRARFEQAGYPLAKTDTGIIAQDPWGTTLRLVAAP